MEKDVKIPFYLKWWFFIPISFIIFFWIGSYIFSFFFPQSSDYNIAKLMLLIWIGVLITWWTYKKRYNPQYSKLKERLR